MTINELLNTRLDGLRETKTQLELSLEPLQATKDEIVLIERMLAFTASDVSAPAPVVVGERSGEVLRTPSEPSVEEPTTPQPRRHTAEELFRAEGRIL